MNKTLILNSISLLEDAKWYLQRISGTEFCQPLTKLSGATIGQHTRHFIEFFQCLLEQMSHPHRILNYDLRRRDKAIENSPAYAIGMIDEIAAQLPALKPDEAILLEYVDSGTNSTSFIFTTPERELLYNIEHTIHHFALIKIGLMIAAPYLDIPPHFGVAPSTLKFRAAMASLETPAN